MRSRTNLLFVVFILTLTTGIVFFYGRMQQHFSPIREFEARLSNMADDLEREKLRTAWVADQLLDYQTQVAKYIPETKVVAATAEGLRIRGIASVTLPPSEAKLQTGEFYLNRGKSFFKEQKFKQATVEFQTVIERFPASPSLVDAHFFLAEIGFLVEDYISSVRHIETMMTHFPDHEMTGYAMLRMSEMLQMRNRPTEAAEVLETIKENFKGHKVLSDTAMIRRQAIEL